MTSPHNTTPRWVLVMLSILAMTVFNTTFWLVLGIAAVLLVAIRWFYHPGELVMIGILLLPVLVWQRVIDVGRRARQLPAVNTTLRKAADGRLVWPDPIPDLGVGGGIAVAAGASDLPWWARLLGVLVGCGIAAEVVSTSIRIRRSRSRARRSVEAQ